ncbi:MAG: hypothetical protein AAGJ74_12990 [Pseudomonadota bacterium]
MGTRPNMANTPVMSFVRDSIQTTAHSFDRGNPMAHTLHSTLARAPGRLAQDFAGAAALALMFIVGLNLPALF